MWRRQILFFLKTKYLLYFQIGWKEGTRPGLFETSIVYSGETLWIDWPPGQLKAGGDTRIINELLRYHPQIVYTWMNRWRMSPKASLNTTLEIVRADPARNKLRCWKTSQKVEQKAVGPNDFCQLNRFTPYGTVHPLWLVVFNGCAWTAWREGGYNDFIPNVQAQGDVNFYMMSFLFNSFLFKSL